ncbi:MAG: hypothetical protein LBD24_04170 [Spirochaetaceae bacterium]|nr:hypothetical protein [Spirochaetaceae bacterium]
MFETAGGCGHAETAGGCGHGVAPFGNNKRPCLKQPEAADTVSHRFETTSGHAETAGGCGHAETAGGCGHAEAAGGGLV